jgi:branched-chain amino acid transport system substrate-binding protein
MQTTLADQGELTSATLYKTAQDKIWTGQLTYTDGIIMPRYAFDAQSLPDPIVGKGNFLFPVLQYHGGQGTIVWPPEWVTGTIQGKP